MHTHGHGTSIYSFKTETDPPIGWHGEETESIDELKPLFEALEADVEFDRGETVDIMLMADDIPVIEF